MEAPDGERKFENFSVLTKTTSGYPEPEKNDKFQPNRKPLWGQTFSKIYFGLGSNRELSLSADNAIQCTVTMHFWETPYLIFVNFGTPPHQSLFRPVKVHQKVREVAPK